MLALQVIGNLGADAQVRSANGRCFVSFNVAHNFQRTNRETGEVQAEERVWVSCALSGDGGGLLPYLTKGTLVYVAGQPHFKLYKGAQGTAIDVSLSVDSVRLLPKPITRAEQDNVNLLFALMEEAEKRGFKSFDEWLAAYDKATEKKKK